VHWRRRRTRLWLAQALWVGEVDLSDPVAAGRAIDAVVRQQGRLDALVNVAGAFRWETLEQGTVATWDLLYAVNLRTAVATSQAALPHLLAAGDARIVNIGAAAATRAASGMGAYAASKAGVARLTKSLADELKDRDVTVNAVLPSIIDTPANRAEMPDADVSRWVTPAQIAEVIVFLLSDAGWPITGALLPVTGRV
jgi:NAD(P)-dependent dehydrogenase (short-subunit alcohol dehydrogenase family)